LIQQYELDLACGVGTYDVHCDRSRQQGSGNSIEDGSASGGCDAQFSEFPNVPVDCGFIAACPTGDDQIADWHVTLLAAFDALKVNPRSHQKYVSG